MATNSTASRNFYHIFATRREAWRFFSLVNERGGLVGFPTMIDRDLPYAERRWQVITAGHRVG